MINHLISSNPGIGEAGMADDRTDIFSYIKKSIHIPKDVILKESANELLGSLIVSKAGFYEKAFGHRVVDRSCDEYVMVYCLDGKGSLEISGNRWIIGKGDLFICNIDLCHSYSADDKEPWTILWVHFTGNKAESFLALLNLSSGSPVMNIGYHQKITYMFNEIFSSLENGYNAANLIYSSTCLLNILGYITRIRISSGNSHQGFNIDEVIEYMRANINRAFSLEDFSGYLKISPSHFCRVFRKITGYSPIDYFIRLKMQKACELLDRSDMRIKEISRYLGYDNQYYFSLVFKKIVGYSPKEYRKLLNG